MRLKMLEGGFWAKFDFREVKKQMIYDLLAPIYDEVNVDFDYEKWADFFECAVEKYYLSGKKPEFVLDLGCGTGKMSLILAKRGYDMTGVDVSPEMLDIARESAAKAGYGKEILWLMQDMREFELYGTVDAVVSCLDCINHLTSKSDLEKTFSLVHNYLIPDGLFIFDINGKSKFENVYARNSYVTETDSSVCIWQNYYNEKSKICDFYITVFNENKDGDYTRFDGVQREKMYTVRAIKSALQKCGFEFLGAFGGFDFVCASDNDERIYIVAKSIKSK